MPIIDFHVHILDKDVLARSDNKTVLTGFGTRPVVKPLSDPKRKATFDQMLIAERQIEDMDRRGIDRHVISASTVIQGTSWAQPQEDYELCRKTNDTTAEWCAKYPDRFIGSFVLPLQDIDLSMREFERATGELKFKVANLGAAYKGFYLGHARYTPYWDAAKAKDVVTFVHPEGTSDLWFQDFWLWNSVGQPIEEAKVMSSIIYEGIFDRYPGIKIVMAHGGGYLPHYFGRLDRNVTNAPDSMRNISSKPSDYFRSFYYDTCTYAASVTEALIRRVGADRLVMGSDIPVGDPDPVKSVNEIPGLDDAMRARIKGGAAAELLGL